MSSAAASLARRRAQEKIVKEREDFLKDESTASYVAQWEAKTSIRIEKQDLLNRANQLKEVEATSLKQRQLNVMELYSKEESEWAIKIKNSHHVSSDDRMNQIREKALRLKAQREKDRQEFVKNCYERQWRDGCDELRTLHAKAISDKVMHDRKNMECQNEHDKVLNEMNEEQEAQTLVNSKETNSRERTEKNLETKKALDAQMAYIRQRNQKITEEKRLEEEEKLKTWQHMDMMERAKEKAARDDARLRGNQILIENTKRIEAIEREKDVHRVHDSILLDYALHKEHQEIQKEKEQKYQGKEAAREYLKFLSDQMVREQEDNNVVESIRNKEMDKIWQKREILEKNKHEARRKLLSEVHASRLQQIRDKELIKKKEIDELAKQAEINQMEWEREEQAAKKEALQKKEATVRNMLANKETMEENSRLRAKEKQDELLLQQRINIDDKKHMERVEQEAKNVVTNFPRRKSEMFS